MLRRRAPMKRSRPKGLPQTVRAKVLDRDFYSCGYCGDGPTAIREKGCRLEIHHRLPKGRGGTDDLSNLVTICGYGNAAGCHRLMDEERQGAMQRGFVIPGTVSAEHTTWVPVLWHDGEHYWLFPDGTRRDGSRAA